MPAASATQRKRKTMNQPAITFATLALLVLSGCAAPYGRQDSARSAYLPTHVRVLEKDNVGSFCIDNSATLGCVVRLRETHQCIVFVKSGLPDELHGHVITSETKRCLESA